MLKLIREISYNNINQNIMSIEKLKIKIFFISLETENPSIVTIIIIVIFNSFLIIRKLLKNK